MLGHFKEAKPNTMYSYSKESGPSQRTLQNCKILCNGELVAAICNLIFIILIWCWSC
ncbi:hypothetical protein HanRHA438_Chr14g0668761 [Helianthus annuus]|nr:hypothetical protein HanRHA438_Chr14g0668761 [Helianthus annuus]